MQEEGMAALRILESFETRSEEYISAFKLLGFLPGPLPLSTFLTNLPMDTGYDEKG